MRIPERGTDVQYHLNRICIALNGMEEGEYTRLTRGLPPPTGTHSVRLGDATLFAGPCERTADAVWFAARRGHLLFDTCCELLEMPRDERLSGLATRVAWYRRKVDRMPFWRPEKDRLGGGNVVDDDGQWVGMVHWSEARAWVETATTEMVWMVDLCEDLLDMQLVSESTPR